MLSVKNLTKTYNTKGGVAVRALDNVTLDFPDRGMVFLLGKSGSGKSTLLNVAGGLDVPDSGEIIVKGRSSADFTPADFDSYRNTYVGFIFQEYNILNEYNVEQNIALALQLQGRKNDREATNKILEQVELNGLGHRKPLTLSGGQKQRVAIARALIKEPEIIMADEPTGALDSVTGKDVLNTLKRLSKDKLVIVVSHDVEFAELYGDRIIELKDGKVISDTTKNYTQAVNITENIRALGDNTISIKSGGKLTDEDKVRVLALLDGGDGEIIISASPKKIENFKKSNRITDEGSQEYFAQTKAEDIKTEKHDGSKTAFIKSRLPLKHAAKIGASSLKAKPIRLILTILISMLAFGMFGVVSTMMMYDVNFTAAKALEGTAYSSAVLQKRYSVHTTNTYVRGEYGEEHVEKYEYINNVNTLTSPSDLEALNNKEPGVSFAGVFNLDGGSYTQSYSIANYGNNYELARYYSNTSFKGFSDAGEAYLFEVFGESSRIAGSYPTQSNEIAVSEYMYEVIREKGLLVYDEFSGVYDEIEIIAPEHLIGKTIVISGQSGLSLNITGIYKTGTIDPKFDDLKSDDYFDYNSKLFNEFSSVFSMYHSLAYVSGSFYADCAEQGDGDNGIYTFASGNADIQFSNCYIESGMYFTFLNFILPEWLSGRMNQLSVYSLDGNAMQSGSVNSLKRNETFISAANLYYRAEMLRNAGRVISGVYESYNEYNPEFSDLCNNLYGYIFGSPQDNYNHTVLQSDLKSLLTAVRNDWDSWVKNNNSQGNENYGAIGDFDKAYYNGGHLKIAGIYFLENYNSDSYWIVNEELIKESSYYWYDIVEHSTKYTVKADGKYAAVITPMETTMDKLNYILSLNIAKSDDSLFEMTDNSVYSNASSVGYTFKQMSWVFMIIGVTLAVISALFLLNYISISIVDKSREIGILRAVGARGTDVFKIFYSESFIITGICTVLAIIVAIVVCIVVNMLMSWSEFAFQFLNFTVLNALIIVAIAVVVTLVATILPVWRAAKKAPVESIRSL